MSNKELAPAINLTGFNCPHCGVRAVQTWHNCGVRQIYRDDESSIPMLPDEEIVKQLKTDKDIDEKFRKTYLDYCERMIAGRVTISDEDSTYYVRVENVFLAQCQHCKETSVWIKDRMVYPSAGEITAHEDLPGNIKLTFNEASKIADISPRASAALSRLVIQELCEELECKSERLNDQIGELVSRGLNPDISKMLDSVRVIGNNALHPGEIDVKDDVQTAKFLLLCINRICQRMITEKKDAAELFDMLPEGAKNSIQRRDGKASQIAQKDKQA